MPTVLRTTQPRPKDRLGQQVAVGSAWEGAGPIGLAWPAAGAAWQLRGPGTGPHVDGPGPGIVK